MTRISVLIRAVSCTRLKPRSTLHAAICLGIFFLLPLQSKANTPWYVFVSDGSSNLIRQYDMQGTEVRQIRNREFNFPTFLAADPENGFLYTDINFQPSGEL